MSRVIASFLFLMMTWSALAQNNRYVIAFLRPNHSQIKGTTTPINVQKLMKEKKLLAAGRFENEGGVFIFNSISVEEVKGWLDQEAGITNWQVEVLPFTLRAGSICHAIQPAETVNYQFIRYDANIAKFNIQEAPELFGKHDDYLKSIHKTGNTLLDGIFGDSDGGVLIMKGVLEPAVIENDPAVREGLLEANVKTIYLAKGVLCDK
jgi:uncharacterized protein YciI